jgi:competence protein ComEC
VSAIFALIVVAIIAVAVIALNWNSITASLGLNETPQTSRPSDDSEVQVHFLDVGQGDCALILTHDAAVLIDSGDTAYADRVIQYLRRVGVSKLDYIIVSHPHADHIGGMDKIIAAIGVEKLLMPRLPDELVPTTGVFERMLDAVEAYSVEIAYTHAGDSIDAGGARIDILAPHPDSVFNGVNDYSAVARLVYRDNSMLFTGDMERAAENDILERGTDISADVLKVAHHGSRTSSQQAFIEAAGGQTAVIGVGSPNRYNHPTDDVLNRLEAAGYEILRTDVHGTIVFRFFREGRKEILYGYN